MIPMLLPTCRPSISKSPAGWPDGDGAAAISVDFTVGSLYRRGEEWGADEGVRAAGSVEVAPGSGLRLRVAASATRCQRGHTRTPEGLESGEQDTYGGWRAPLNQGSLDSRSEEPRRRGDQESIRSFSVELNVELIGYTGTCYLSIGLDSRLQVSECRHPSNTSTGS
jgi:hypothetical protein